MRNIKDLGINESIKKNETIDINGNIIKNNQLFRKGIYLHTFTEIQARIIHFLTSYRNGVSRETISNKLDLPKTTIFDNLKILEKLELVKRFASKDFRKRVGRPIIKWILKTYFEKE